MELTFESIVFSATEKVYGIGIRIHLVSISDDCHKPRYGFPHIGQATLQGRFWKYQRYCLTKAVQHRKRILKDFTCCTVGYFESHSLNV